MTYITSDIPRATRKPVAHSLLVPLLLLSSRQRLIRDNEINVVPASDSSLLLTALPTLLISTTDKARESSFALGENYAQQRTLHVKRMLGQIMPGIDAHFGIANKHVPDTTCGELIEFCFVRAFSSLTIWMRSRLA